ncbi:hypothetical protein F4777DRAFT_536978 [Nemania sp. FL0916]|nr:hypothetical protein F4777DRAFT_536978 [Nemania sp. FL0916]
MAEPVGITGTAIAAMTLLYNTCKEVHDIIVSYKRAEREYQEIASALQAIQTILDQLRANLEPTDGTAPLANQRKIFEDLKPALDICNKDCEAFKNKLANLTSHSTKGHTKRIDKSRLHLNTNDIAVFRTKLMDSKNTLDVALSWCTLNTSNRTQQTLNEFQENTATTLSEFTGKLDALALAVQSLSISEVTIPQEDVAMITRTLNEQHQLLKQNLQFCTTALGAVQSEMPSTQVRFVKARENARQMIGNYGTAGEKASSIVVENVEAEGHAIQSIGNFSGDAWAAILRNRRG